jgi:hypothetical protein
MGLSDPLREVRKSYRIIEHEKHPCYDLILHFTILYKEKMLILIIQNSLFQ